MVLKRKRDSQPQHGSANAKPLEDEDFHYRVCRGLLTMRAPNTHDRHFVMLPENENPAVAVEDQTIPLGHQRFELFSEQEIRTAESWSSYFYDKLYGHPQHLAQPENISDCHIIGLFKSDLVIDAISKKRPGGMYWTFNRMTKLLQKVTGRSVKGGWKEPPVYLGDLPGYEEFRSADRDEGYNWMDEVLPGVDEPEDEPKVKRLRLYLDANDEPAFVMREPEQNEVQNVVDLIIDEAQNVVYLTAADKTQDAEDLDATINLTQNVVDLTDRVQDGEDSDAIIDLTQNLEDIDITDDEDWKGMYPKDRPNYVKPSRMSSEASARVESIARAEAIARHRRQGRARLAEEALSRSPTVEQAAAVTAEAARVVQERYVRFADEVDDRELVEVQDDEDESQDDEDEDDYIFNVTQGIRDQLERDECNN